MQIKKSSILITWCKVGQKTLDIEYLQRYQGGNEYLRCMDLNGQERDCTVYYCTIALAENFVKKYRVNVLEGMGSESCNSTGNCTISRRSSMTEKRVLV